MQIRVKLSDHIEPLDERRFRLGSRHADMVNVAGKRASLSALTAQLLGVEGVTDGCFFSPRTLLPKNRPACSAWPRWSPPPQA